MADMKNGPGSLNPGAEQVITEGDAVGSSVSGHDDIVASINHFQWRLIQDALCKLTAEFWRRRADEFEAAIHQPGDFPGLCSVEQIQTNNSLLMQKAQACRNRATLCQFQDFEEVLTVVLEGVA